MTEILPGTDVMPAVALNSSAPHAPAKAEAVVAFVVLAFLLLWAVASKHWVAAMVVGTTGSMDVGIAAVEPPAVACLPKQP